MLDTTRLGCGLVRVYSEMLIDHDKGVGTPVILEPDRHYILTKEIQMQVYEMPISKCIDCKDQPLLCRMKYHSLERWYYVWSWPGIYWVFKKIHRKYCPNKKVSK